MGKRSFCRCRLCGSEKYHFLFKKNNYSIRRCRLCGLIFTGENFSLKEAKQYYSEDYFIAGEQKSGYYDYIAEEEMMRRNGRVRLEELKRLASGKKLLDIGCATGFFLDEARRKFRVEGVEISKFAALYARKRFHLNIHNNPLQKFKNEKVRFDVITLWDIIEHFSDPNHCLEIISSIMKKDGILALSTGDAGSLFAGISGRFWHLFTPPQHLSYFDKSTLRLLLEKHAFEILKIENKGALYTLSYLLFALKVKLPFLHLGFLYSLIHRTPLGRRDIYINFGDIMVVYAKKK